MKTVVRALPGITDHIMLLRCIYMWGHGSQTAAKHMRRQERRGLTALTDAERCKSSAKKNMAERVIFKTSY